MLNSFHYSAEITPLLVLSSLEGMLIILKKKWGNISVFLLALAILSNMYYGFAFYYGTYAFRFGENGPSDFLRTTHSKIVDRVLTTIPSTASISCEYAICSHINRPFGKKLPIPHPKTLEYVILDPTNPSVLTDQQTYKSFVEERIFPNYEMIAKDDGVILFKSTR